jgi:glycosyltransferase involved in cell wall biosynthesis
MLPEISTIIPTYRRPAELFEAVSSALRQTGVRVEVIVVDDSPEGSAGAVVEAIEDSRVTYLQNTPPTGGCPSVVRNLGLRSAKADLIHFLDDDDIVPDGHYARVLRRFADKPEVGLVFGTIQPFGNGPEGQLVDERRFFKEAGRLAGICRITGSRLAFVSTQLFHHVLLVCSAGVVRRECAAAIGGFDPRLRLMEDADFFAFIMRRFGVDFIDDVALHYRISSRQSLMHLAMPSTDQATATSREIHEAKSTTYAKYKAAFGLHEFFALKVFARTVMRVL